MTAIYKRELKSLFTGMIAPIFIAFLLMMTGIYSVARNFSGGYPQFELTLSSLSFIYIIIIPILTMRSFSEEKATKTDQLLYSLPISTSSVVIGKYLAMVSVLGISALLMCFYPIIISIYGTVYFPTAYASIFAFFLLGCALIAIGMFISTVSESQVISAIISIGAFILIFQITGISSLVSESAWVSFALFILVCAALGIVVYLMTKNAFVASAFGALLVCGLSVLYFIKSSLFAGAFGKMLNACAIFQYINNFIYGVFDLSAVIYFVSVIVLFGFLAVQSVDKKRWN